MRHCSYCRHITAGQPLFCMFCARTYDVRLCPRLHANPRRAEVCAQCGSRDLTEPQPRGTWSRRLLQSGLPMLPTVLVVIVGIVVMLAMVNTILADEQVQGQFVMLMLLIVAGWIAWSKLPGLIRTGLRRGLTRITRRNKGERH